MTMQFAASQDAFAEALLHADRPLPAGITSARGDNDAARFAVYRNNVFVGLTNALAQRFPVTKRLVGAEFFTAMARAYAQSNKPSSPLIMEYGEDFPEFVAAFEAASALAYLPDVVRLEACWTRAYHAADAAPIEISALAALDPETLPAARLSVHSSAALLRSAYPIGSIWAAHQQDSVGPVANPTAETILIVRPAMEVGIHIIPPSDAGFAEALFGGASLGAAADMAAARQPGFDFGAALVGLITLGAFGAVITEGGTV